MLSEQYPELEIFHEWADEDIGMNCGRREYKSGDLIYEYYPEGDEATAFALPPADFKAVANPSMRAYANRLLERQ